MSLVLETDLAENFELSTRYNLKVQIHILQQKLGDSSRS